MQTDSTTHYCSPTLLYHLINLSGIQKIFLHLCQLLPSLATHFNTSNIEIKQAFSHLSQVTSQWLAMQCFLLTETGVPTSGRLTPALQGSLDIYDSTPAQGQGCTTCPCAALVSPGETVSIKVHTVYSDGLNRMKFVYRSWTLQGRPQNCIMVRAKRRLVRQDAVPFIFSYHRNTLISAATFIRSSKCPLKKPT